MIDVKTTKHKTPKTKEQWEHEMTWNTSFRGRVMEICEILQIRRDELKDYWIKSQYGLIYIIGFARKHKKLP